MATALVFAYGSLADPRSVELTLGGPVDVVGPARLSGWRRGWTAARDNRTAEKRFAPAAGGEPFAACLLLDLEPDPDAPAPNGALLRLDAAALERLDRRELRYERVEVTDAVVAAGELDGPVFAYRALARYHRPRPPRGAVILAAYLETVRAAFAALGAGELERFERTTAPPPVPVVDGVLVADRAPPGNPRAW